MKNIPRRAFPRRLLAAAISVATVGLGATGLDRAGAAAATKAPANLKPSSPLSIGLLDIIDDGAAASTSPRGPVARAAGVVPEIPTEELFWREDGRLLVDVRLDVPVTAGVVAALESTGANVVSTDADRRLVSVESTTGDLVEIAAVTGVRAVSEVHRPMSSAICPTGIVSEGDTQLLASTARSTNGLTGAGVMVGVLSDSFATAAGPITTAATDVVQGDLPGTTNPCGHPLTVDVQSEPPTAQADEGRAMSHIIHDLAPGAKIRNATAWISETSFASEIRALATAGAKVIVDDIFYFNEPMYQDGVIAQAIADVTAAGVTYFSAAGNETVFLNGNNVSSYETPAYRPAPCPAVVATHQYAPQDCHDFDPGPGIDTGWGGTRSTGTARYVLGWDEPQNGVSTDLEFFLVNRVTNAVTAYDLDDNKSTGIASAYIPFGVTSQFDLVVGRYQSTGTPRFKMISVRSQVSAIEYPVSSGGDIVGPALFGHGGSRAAISVGAVPYNNANALELYSTRGPASTCWTGVVGSTPGMRLPSCVTSTVDMVATDGGANPFFGSFVNGAYRFYGTSASAPHAAAVAALMLEAAPCLSPRNVERAMKSGAAPIAGYDVNSQGAGRLDAVNAVANAKAICAGTFRTTTPVSASAAVTPPARAGIAGAAPRTPPARTATAGAPG